MVTFASRVLTSDAGIATIQAMENYARKKNNQLKINPTSLFTK